MSTLTLTFTLTLALTFTLTLALTLTFTLILSRTRTLARNLTRNLTLGSLATATRDMFPPPRQPQSSHSDQNPGPIPAAITPPQPHPDMLTLLQEGEEGAVGFISPLLAPMYPVKLVRLDEKGELLRVDGKCVPCKPGEPGRPPPSLSARSFLSGFTRPSHTRGRR